MNERSFLLYAGHEACQEGIPYHFGKSEFFNTINIREHRIDKML